MSEQSTKPTTGLSPIENPDLLVAMISSAFAARSTLSVVADVSSTVKSAVAAWIDADRAYRAYIKELSDTSQQDR